ncbi:hypothetical protein [Microbacterium sp. ZW T5_56]|uniref:hypothetical protein n=1 Tax=Microbacterium sp. ZW T5_56 TaxID=3378081 RepID=UPI0038553063
MKRTSLLLAGLLTAGAIALSGCSAPASDSGDTSPSTPAAEPTAKDTPIAEEPSASPTEDAPAASGEIEKITVTSPTVTDPAREDTATATAIAFGFTGSGDWATAPGGATYVAVEYTVTRGAKYYGGVSCTSLQLATSDMNVPTSDITTSVKEDMAAQGLTPLDDVESGATGTGWCMYYVQNPTKDNLTVSYTRLAAKDGDKEIPALDEKMPLTAG